MQVRSGVSLFAILGEFGSTTNKRRQCTYDLGFFYLPITLGSDNAGLLYNEYQVRMAMPRRQWKADYPGEIEKGAWHAVKQCEGDRGFSYLPNTLGSGHSDLLHDVYQVRMARP